MSAASTADTPALELVTTAQACRRLDVSRHQIGNYVDEGRLPVAAKVPGRSGAYLFDPAQVERLAGELADEAEARATQLRAAVS